MDTPSTLREQQDGADRAESDLSFEGGGEEHESSLPDAVREVEAGRVTEPGQVEVDATEWFMESDTPTAEEVTPTTIKLNVGTPDAKKIIEWQVVPLPDDEFRKFRKASMPRAARRGTGVAGAMDMDDGRYHLLVVTAATVSPDLREIARRKGVQDPAQVVKHRFAAKPGLISQISGVVSDISGYDESDLEVVAGNS